MSENSVADDMLRAGYERWYHLEEEKTAIGEDLKELFAELKGNGFTPKALRESFRRFRNINDADQQEHDAVVDLYLVSLAGARPAHTRGDDESTAHIPSNTGRVSAKSAAASTTPEHDADGVFKEQPQAIRAETVKLLNTVSDAMQTDAGRAALITALDVMIEREELSEPQPAPAARDLTSPQALNGQVATHPEAKASEDDGTTGQAIETTGDSVTGDVSRASVGAGSDAPIQPETADMPHSSDPALEQGLSDTRTDLIIPSSGHEPGVRGAGGAANLYADPGIIVMEHTGPEPYAQHPYAECWLIYPVDVTDGVREPIVKIGALILDGRGRFLAARSVRVADKLTMEYPTVQYDGDDALLDCIRWNLASRSNMTAAALRVVAGKLCKIEPTRADDIMGAFGLAEMQEAAQ